MLVTGKRDTFLSRLKPSQDATVSTRAQIYLVPIQSEYKHILGFFKGHETITDAWHACLKVTYYTVRSSRFKARIGLSSPERAEVDMCAEVSEPRRRQHVDKAVVADGRQRGRVGAIPPVIDD